MSFIVYVLNFNGICTKSKKSYFNLKVFYLSLCYKKLKTKTK